MGAVASIVMNGHVTIPAEDSVSPWLSGGPVPYSNLISLAPVVVTITINMMECEKYLVCFATARTVVTMNFKGFHTSSRNPFRTVFFHKG